MDRHNKELFYVGFKNNEQLLQCLVSLMIMTKTKQLNSYND